MMIRHLNFMVGVICSVCLFCSNHRLINGYSFFPPYCKHGKSHCFLSLSSSSCIVGMTRSARYNDNDHHHCRLRVVCNANQRNHHSNNNDNNYDSNNDEKQQQQRDHDRIGTTDGIHNQHVASSMSQLQRSQEKQMESVSLEGATRISQLSIAERTKRAMLAEVMEDTIFRHVETIDQYYHPITGVLYDEKNRRVVNEMIQEIQTYQKQYNELVSGEASTLLNTFETLSSSSSSKSSASSSIKNHDNHDSLL
jgi:hypothetical protein